MKHITLDIETYEEELKRERLAAYDSITNAIIEMILGNWGSYEHFSSYVEGSDFDEAMKTKDWKILYHTIEKMKNKGSSDYISSLPRC